MQIISCDCSSRSGFVTPFVWLHVALFLLQICSLRSSAVKWVQEDLEGVTGGQEGLMELSGVQLGQVR